MLMTAAAEPVYGELGLSTSLSMLINPKISRDARKRPLAPDVFNDRAAILPACYFSAVPVTKTRPDSRSRELERQRRRREKRRAHLYNARGGPPAKCPLINCTFYSRGAKCRAPNFARTISSVENGRVTISPIFRHPATIINN